MKDVEFFASNFPKVHSAILDKLMKALSERTDISYKNENNIASLGKTTYKYSYKIF
uniref:DNA helicase n=1 Tax=Heterorhabditis bacteriophora TaxID=37862 RepID=A0A1I7WIM3_HETBA